MAWLTSDDEVRRDLREAFALAKLDIAAEIAAEQQESG